jgi:hypothetical protein
MHDSNTDHSSARTSYSLNRYTLCKVTSELQVLVSAAKQKKENAREIAVCVWTGSFPTSGAVVGRQSHTIQNLQL